MWDWATDEGRLDISKDQRHTCGYGMINIFREIGWRHNEDHIALRFLNGNQFQDRSKHIIECIKQHAEKWLRNKLDQLSKH